MLFTHYKHVIFFWLNSLLVRITHIKHEKIENCEFEPTSDTSNIYATII